MKQTAAVTQTFSAGSYFNYMEDAKALLTSGKLEMYVLGMLTPRERDHIEQLAVLHPELQSEIDRLHKALRKSAPDLNPEPGEEK